jgi:CDP-diglyceride synthetase
VLFQLTTELLPVFCVDPFIIIASCLGCSALARKKGHSGLLFAILNAVVVIGAELTGALAGLLVGMKLDPFLNKDTAIKPLIGGAIGGLVFGILLMFIVISLVPDRNRGLLPPRRRRPKIRDDEPFS